MIDRYQTTSHTPEALYRLVEAYLTLGLLDEAKRNGAVLGYNYPGDVWYGDAYNLLTDQGPAPGGASRSRAASAAASRLPFARDKEKTIAAARGDRIRTPRVQAAPQPAPADAACPCH